MNRITLLSRTNLTRNFKCNTSLFSQSNFEVLLPCFLFFVTTRLAENRSNPNLLDIGGVSRAGIADGTNQYLKGEDTSSELTLSKSVDDLLMLWRGNPY